MHQLSMGLRGCAPVIHGGLERLYTSYPPGLNGYAPVIHGDLEVMHQLSMGA